MPFAEDLTPFFAPTDFGTTATYTHGSDDPVEVNGIFDNDYALGEEMLEDASPRFMCAAADVPGVVHDDTLEIDGVTYAVKNVQPDGTGVVMLILQVQP